MSDFGTMVTRIESELARTDQTALVKEMIVSAVEHHERERFFFNETITTFVTAADQENYTHADTSLSDMVSLSTVKVTVNQTSYVLTEKPYDWIEAISTSTSFTGYPYKFAQYQEQLYLYPIPNASYTAEVSHVTRLTDTRSTHTADHISKSSSNSFTNAWFTTGFDLVKQRAKALLKIDVLEDEMAIQQSMAIGYTGCISPLEKIALDRLRGETIAKTTSGRIMPTEF